MKKILLGLGAVASVALVMVRAMLNRLGLNIPWKRQQESVWPEFTDQVGYERHQNLVMSAVTAFIRMNPLRVPDEEEESE